MIIWNQDFIIQLYNCLCLWVANYGATNTYGHPDPELMNQLQDFSEDMTLALNSEIYQIMKVIWKS